MEKKSNLLDLNLKYQDLLWRIVGAMRRRARNVPAFRDSHNGCIRITIVPLSRIADEWLGGLNDYRRGHLGMEIVDTCEREFVFKIDPRGSHTIQCVCEDGHTEPVNCYGYSALKTAWASWKRKMRKSFGEPYMRYFTEENGWSMHDGSVYTTITLDGEDFIRLYVCTSGAESSEDKECSLAGILEAQECFVHYGDRVKFSPYIDPKRSPLEQVWCD